MQHSSQTFKILTLNIWMERGPNPERWDTLKEKLVQLNPDLIAMQEVVQSNQFPNKAAFLAESLSYESKWERAKQNEDREQGLAVLSKFPMLSSNSITLPTISHDENRILQRVEIDAPWGKQILMNTHLNYLKTDTAIREQQVLTMDEHVQQCQTQLPILVAGDFNACETHSPIQFLTGKISLKERSTHYIDCYRHLKPTCPGYTWSDTNPFNYFSKPSNVRIDYIFLYDPPPFKQSSNESSQWTIQSAEIVCNTPGKNGVFASDHFGVMVEFSIDATTEHS